MAICMHRYTPITIYTCTWSRRGHPSPWHSLGAPNTLRNQNLKVSTYPPMAYYLCIYVRIFVCMYVCMLHSVCVCMHACVYVDDQLAILSIIVDCMYVCDNV